MSGTTSPASWRSLCTLLLAFLASLNACPNLRAAVILSEVHYEPQEGSELELIELQNTSPSPVDLEGWSFGAGLDYDFGAGAVIPGNGFLLVARNPGQVVAHFGLDASLVLGPYSGSLDNGGEEIELRDGSRAVVDTVTYDDALPWDVRAAGQGASLQRVCSTFDGESPSNWEAAGAPTPLAPNPRAQCPPPSLTPPVIGINEILYHAPNLLDQKHELIELRNNSTESVNLKGYHFTQGLDYTFPEDTVLEPGGLLVVCRDVESVKTTFGVTRAYGPFTGQLANGGERITLVDANGAFVDSVRYGEQGAWPVAADGRGASLEKIRPDAPSSDPMSWAAADLPAGRSRQRVVVQGKATSTVLAFELDGSSEYTIDNLSLVDVANPGKNLIQNGTFDRGIVPVNLEGLLGSSGWDPSGGTGRTGCLRLKYKDFGGGKGPFLELQGIISRATIDLTSVVTVNGPTYELAFDFVYATGNRGARVAFLSSTAERGIFWRFDPLPVASPGKVNTVNAEKLPPHITSVSRSVREPRATDAVSIAARVRSESPLASVKLEYSADWKTEVVTVDGHDDGAHDDGEAGDGVYGMPLGQFPHNTIVTFRVRAEDTAGAITYSPPDNDPSQVHGFYVNDLQPASTLPILNLLLQHTSRLTPRRVIDQLDCQHYWTGSFAYRGDFYPLVNIRMRGASVCMTKKPYLKLRFAHGREFKNQRKVNLQGLWTDKSLVRERLAFDLFADLGVPAAQHRFARIHANGAYYGLYATAEHLDGRYLERAGLDPDGNLYKSVGSNEEPNGGDPGPWEKKTNENGDFSDLKLFLKDMHQTSVTKLREFFPARTLPDEIIEYQAAQILGNNIDHTSHNHYLYHDLVADKWIALPWDLDLTFGKAGVFDDNEYIPGTGFWFGTSVDGEFQSYLLDRFFSDAGSWYRRAFIVRMWDTLHERFTVDFYEARLSALRLQLFEEQDQDIKVWGRLTDQGGGQFPRDFDSNLNRVRFFVKERSKFLLNYLDTRLHMTGHPRLIITELNYNPPGGEDQLEFIELWNPGAAAVELAGWTIEAVGYTFPAGAKAEPDEVLVVAKDPAAFEARYGRVAKILGPYEGGLDNDGESLRLRDKGQGYPATIDLVEYSSRNGWPRAADGTGKTLELTNISEWRDNHDLVHWRASGAEGGSPGVIEKLDPARRSYSRGDANADGGANLADALSILGYLFQGAGEPACLAAADLNGSGELKLDDVLLLLRHLFQGSTEPIPFPGPGECGPTSAETCATSTCS